MRLLSHDARFFEAPLILGPCSVNLERLKFAIEWTTIGTSVLYPTEF